MEFEGGIIIRDSASVSECVLARLSQNRPDGCDNIHTLSSEEAVLSHHTSSKEEDAFQRR